MEENKQNKSGEDVKPQSQKQEPSIEEKLAGTEKQRDEYLAGWQRARADFLNYKKEEAGRLESIIKFANEDILEELIEVLDTFDLGLAALEKAGPVEKGVYMVRSKLDNVLKQRGLECLPVKAGDKFNPSLSEAIVEAESDQPAGTILEVIEAGYKLHDKVLRPARVKISRGK
ncbi:MAG: nucleotide exchange factor GrpE [Patescibacteria group bacterium]